MKILMIGLGSIGQRHVRNIRQVLGDGAELLAYRVRGAKTTFTDKLQIREGVCAAGGKGRVPPADRKTAGFRYGRRGGIKAPG